MGRREKYEAVSNIVQIRTDVKKWCLSNEEFQVFPH